MIGSPWIAFPDGFTVRDLFTLFGILKKVAVDCDPEAVSYGVKGIDTDHLVVDLEAFAGELSAADWDVEPVVSVTDDETEDVSEVYP